MKRLLTPLSVTLWILCVQAQGTFTFSNLVPTSALDQPVLLFPGVAKVSGPNMVAAVLLNGVQLGDSAPFRTGAGAGYWNAGADSLRVVPGKFAGEVVSGFTVKVWDLLKGNTYEISRSAGGISGVSHPFSVTLGGPNVDASVLPEFPGTMRNFQGFTIGVPEPTVLSLGVFGTAVILPGRRQPAKSNQLLT